MYSTLTYTDRDCQRAVLSCDVQQCQLVVACVDRCVCRSLLNRIEQSDSKQLKLVFDSMDKNKDGHLSREELEEFAIELG